MTHVCNLCNTGAAHVIFATNVFVATAALLVSFNDLEQVVGPHIAEGNLTAIQESLLLSPQALKVQTVLANMQLDWQSNVANVLTYVNGNVSLFDDYLTGEIYSSLSQLFTIYHFEPSVSRRSRDNDPRLCSPCLTPIGGGLSFHQRGYEHR